MRFDPDQGVCFLASKPLQLIICLMLKECLAKEVAATCVLIRSFEGVDDVANRMVSLNVFDNLLVFDGKTEAYEFLSKQRFDSLFIDSDVGFRRFFDLRKIRPKVKRLFVYEEGIGTYRSDLYSGFKKMLLDRVGVATSFGSSGFVDLIYLFHPERYERIFKTGKSVAIGCDLADFLCKNKFVWKIFDADRIGDEGGFFVSKIL